MCTSAFSSTNQAIPICPVSEFNYLYYIIYWDARLVSIHRIGHQVADLLNSDKWQVIIPPDDTVWMSTHLYRREVAIGYEEIGGNHYNIFMPRIHSLVEKNIEMKYIIFTFSSCMLPSICFTALFNYINMLNIPLMGIEKYCFGLEKIYNRIWPNWSGNSIYHVSYNASPYKCCLWCYEVVVS